jgi:Meiotically up-regulated gene 113
MAVYRDPRSPSYWLFDFNLAGQRFHGSTKCRSKRLAQEVERQEFERAKAALHRIGNEDEARRDLVWLFDYFGKDQLLKEIADIEATRSAGISVPTFKPPTTKASRRQLYIYIIGGPGADSPVKIGITARVEDRLRDLQTGHPYPLKILAKCPGDQDQEAALHQRFKNLRITGEWFCRTDAINVLINEITRNELLPTGATTT